MDVSIIIPVYQVEPYIEACLRSVMRQTFTGELECILIDDGGTDGSMAIVERMLAAYQGPVRFRVLHQPQNAGVSAARNWGIEQASGAFIFFLDSDDELSDDCIALLMARASENPALELVQGNTVSFPVANYENYTVKLRMPEAGSNAQVRDCFYRYHQLLVTCWNKLIKRSVIMENGLRFTGEAVSEDTPWTFSLLKHIRCAGFVEQITYRYRIRQGSLVRATENPLRARSQAQIYGFIVTHLSPGFERQELRFHGKNFAYFYARYFKEEERFKEVMGRWQAAAKKYKMGGLRLRLGIGRAMGKTRHGWFLLTLLDRLEEPSILLVDLRRILNRFGLLKASAAGK